MKRYNLVLLCVLFVLLCAAHKSVGAEPVVPALTEAAVPMLLKQIPKLKAGDWAALPGLEIKVLATVQKTETGITLAGGDVYVVVPHPTDVWTQGPVAKYTKTVWNTGELDLRWFVGKDSTNTAESIDNCIVRGEGALLLGHGDANAGDNWGFIRVKIVKILPAKGAKK